MNGTGEFALDGEGLKKLAELAFAAAGERSADLEQTASPAPKFSDAVPKILSAIAGGEGNISPERLNLIKALKPYLQDSRAADVDRAIRMANAARAALGLLGR